MIWAAFGHGHLRRRSGSPPFVVPAPPPFVIPVPQTWLYPGVRFVGIHRGPWLRDGMTEGGDDGFDKIMGLVL